MGEQAGLESFLHGVLTIAADDVGPLARLLGDRLDELRPAVEHPDSIVGAVGGAQGAVRDQPVNEGPSPVLAVVVHAVGIGEESQTVRDGAQLGTEGVGGATLEPADRPGGDAGEHDSGLPYAPQDLIKTMHPPYGQEVGHRAAVDPHDVLLHQVTLDVIQVRHREQAQMGQVEPGQPTGFGHVHLEPRVVARGRADVADPGDNSRGAGQIHGIVEQVSELEAQTVVIPVATGCCEDRWCVSCHVETIGEAIAVPPLVPGFTITSVLSSDAKGSTWAAMRTVDDQPLVLKLIPVRDVTKARAKAVQLMAVLDGIENEHLVAQHGAIALADGQLALVLDRVTGGSLAQLLDQRGNLSPGETVTTLAPLFGALAALHAAGVEHGDLAPRSILFSADGRPLINDVGVARLMGHAGGQVSRDNSLMAPEVAGGAAPSAASDVYSMAAIGWLCLTGAPPDPASTIRCSATVSPALPARLTDVLTSCLSANPTGRPSARAAAIEVFDAVQAESVTLTSVADPATEITRRIRATAAAVSVPAPSAAGKRLRGSLVIGAIALLVMVAVGGSTMWFVSRMPEPARPAGARSSAPVRPAPVTSSTTSGLATADLVPATTTPGSVTDVVTASDSPRVAAAGLLQALVDARALAYAARSPVLLDLVYAPGAARAGADRSNLATALERGATYLGLRFVVKDASFLDGTSDAARIRATILTPAYETGQPDGRRVAHPSETVGPSVFTLSLTRDGWRILALAAP